MRRFFSFFIVMFVAVLTSACINNFAVQKLNDVAMKYINDGDLDSAVSRLEASTDLDGNIYETRYNLAVTYMTMNKCSNALEHITVAQQLKPKEPAVYYTLGVANDCLSRQLYEKKNEKGEIEKITYSDPGQNYAVGLKYVEYLTNAVDNYRKYMDMLPNADDTQEVMRRTQILDEQLTAAKQRYKKSA